MKRDLWAVAVVVVALAAMVVAASLSPARAPCVGRGVVERLFICGGFK